MSLRNYKNHNTTHNKIKRFAVSVIERLESFAQLEIDQVKYDHGRHMILMKEQTKKKNNSLRRKLSQYVKIRPIELTGNKNKKIEVYSAPIADLYFTFQNQG